MADIKVVLFDFDGTLANSGDWFLTKVDELAVRFGFRRVDADEIEALRHRPTREVIAYLGIPRWKLPLIARHVRRLFAAHLQEIALFPGTGQLLETLAKRGVRLALVTSNSESNARAILGDANAALIECWAAGSGLFGKARKFRRVLSAMKVAPDQVVSVGDETRDIDAARAVGMRAGGVLWGYAAEDALAALAPDALFRSHDDLVAWVDARR